MQDIQNRNDIITLVDSFYENVKKHELLGPIFNHIAQVDWLRHLPKMYDFWDFILFGASAYQGHPLRPHLQLNSHHKLNSNHFAAWLALFHSSIDAHFVGPKASEAKERAQGIADTWAYKIDYLNKLSDN
jgi:hemoglobin